jgi:hypothetical protein
MAAAPLEIQLDLAGEVDYDVEHEAFVDRAIDTVKQLRDARPPELVFVHERENVNQATGEAVREAVAVLGPVAVRKAA